MELPRAALGDAAAFLSEGVRLRVCTFGAEVLTARLPEFVEVEVQNSGPSIKVRAAAHVSQGLHSADACAARARSLQNERTDGKQLKGATLTNGATVQARALQLRPSTRLVVVTQAITCRRCLVTSRTATSSSCGLVLASL